MAQTCFEAVAVNESRDDFPGDPTSTVGEIKPQQNKPDTDNPADRHSKRQPANPDISQSPNQISQQTPQAGENDERKNAPTQMTGGPEESIHGAAKPSATAVCPAQTRSPVRTNSLVAAGSSSTTVLPSNILPILWPRSIASPSRTHVSMRRAAMLVIKRTAICSPPLSITRRFCTGQDFSRRNEKSRPSPSMKSSPCDSTLRTFP